MENMSGKQPICRGKVRLQVKKKTYSKSPSLEFWDSVSIYVFR